MSELKSYYVDFEKGYDVGDLYEHKGKEYEVVAIEAFNNLMLVVEIEYGDIKTVWEGQYVKVDLVDTTTECTIANNVYSLTEMMDLHQELAEAFDVTIKELEKLKHVSL